MNGPLTCAECGVELTTADADQAVKTDAGICHRECFSGPVLPGSEVDLDDLELAAENERRRDHGEPELTADEWQRYGPGTTGISVVDGVICADDRTAREREQMAREDLDTPLDPDRRI